MRQPSGHPFAMAVLAAMASIMLSGACAEPRLEVATAAWRDVQVSLAVPTKRPHARLPLRPLESDNPSGALILARLGPQRIALVADQDSRAVRVVDPGSHRELSHLVVSGRPSQMVIGGDGRAYVALRDVSRVVALEVTEATAVTLALADEIPTASEPVGLAVTPTGDTLLVASAWGKTLALYGLDDLHTRATVWLPREPRGVALSADGRFAYVSHAVGPSVSRVALEGSSGRQAGPLERTEVTLSGRDYTLHPETREGTEPPERMPAAEELGRPGTGEHRRVAAQGFAIARLDDQMIVPLVLVHPRRGGPPPPAGGGYPTHQPALAMIDTGDGEAWLRVQHRGWAASRPRGHFAGGARLNQCFLPRAVAVDRLRGTVLVGCLGSDEVVAYDGTRAALAKSWRGRWSVPAGPLGIAVDGSAGVAWVWSQFDSSLSSIKLPDGPRTVPRSLAGEPGDAQTPTKTTVLAPLPSGTGATPALSAEAARGRKLFHGRGLPRAAATGPSCASCHPDGRQDGLVWLTPLGPRRTAPLTGRGQADGRRGADPPAPAAQPTPPACPQLGEGALTAAEVRALVSYLRSLPAPVKPQRAAPSIDSDGRMAQGNEPEGQPLPRVMPRHW